MGCYPRGIPCFRGGARHRSHGHLVVPREVLDHVKGADFPAAPGRIREAMAEIQDLHASIPFISVVTSSGVRLSRYIRDERNADRKSTRLNSSHQIISYAVFCLKK